MAKADKEEMLEEQAMMEQAKSGKAGKTKAMKDNANVPGIEYYEEQTLRNYR